MGSGHTPHNSASTDAVDLFAPANGQDDFAQLKGQFLASLNHELRTPLSGVLGMIDLLLETRLDEEQREYAGTVRECAAQLLETLNCVLDYSALSAGNFRTEESEFLLRPLLESIIEDSRPRAKAKGLRLVADLQDTLPETVVGDDRHLRQCLVQLLRNAVKFTNKGQVELLARVESLSGSRLWLRLDVADTGIGIPPQKLKLIFESFRQLDSGLSRNYTGLGLGLALAEKTVTLMHGEIDVGSEPGVGSTFTIRLPLRMTPVRPGPHLVTRPPGLGRRHRVLVVDDNQIAQQVVARILQRADYEVTVASGGVEGVDLAIRSQYDVILMDLQMPGLDGLAATRTIREVAGYEHIPIVAVTANYSDQDRELCHSAGMQSFLSKPIQKDLLLSTIRGLLAEHVA